MMYNIYKFQENQRMFLSSLFTFFSLFTFHFTSQPALARFGRRLGHGFARGGGRWREDTASGGEGFGTERARLGRDALGTERARLAQGGYRG